MEIKRSFLPIFVLIIAVLGCVGPRSQRSSSADPFKSNAEPSNAPQLKLLSKKGTIEYGYVTVEGQVQNISTERIENVQAVVNHYDGDGNFVTSDSALVEYDPLMPDQTSPYRVGTRYNPAMKTFTIEFKKLLGEQLAVIDGTPEKHPPKKRKK